MAEEKLYPKVKDYLEEQGYYPVKIAPSIKIRGYRPDVTGLRGKEVLCVEVKPDFDEYSVMYAITQARVYMFGATCVYVAFPVSHWNDPKQKDLRDLTEKLCEENGLGIYLINEENSEIKILKNAKISQLIDLTDYDNTIQQLEGKEWIRLENTYPEYVRDLCVYLYKTGGKIERKELFEKLRNNFENNYWLKNSRSPASKDKAVTNRIIGAIAGSIELRFIDVEPDKNGDENKDALILTYAGKILTKLNDKETNINKPEKLDERTKTFFSAYLFNFLFLE